MVNEVPYAYCQNGRNYLKIQCRYRNKRYLMKSRNNQIKTYMIIFDSFPRKNRHLPTTFNQAFDECDMPYSVMSVWSPITHTIGVDKRAFYHCQGPTYN